jgi:hypothetical protein
MARLKNGRKILRSAACTSAPQDGVSDQGEAGVISLSPVSPTISPRYTISEIIQHAGNDREVLAEQIRLQSMVIESLQEKLTERG